MSEQYPPAKPAVVRLALFCLLAGVLTAALLFPVAGGIGVASNYASESVTEGAADVIGGDVPAVSTMVDAAGNTIAWIYVQRRFQVPSERIADTMKLAIVSIEDRRFAEHNGVDIQGTLTGLAGYLKGAVDTRGGSTIEQQYVKNFNLLVTAETDAQRQAAVATTPARKLREIRMALALDAALSKPEILARYLNLISFGNGAYGIQDAARTYFGVNAADFRALVAVAPHVHLQALELDAPLVGHHLDGEVGEVRLAGQRAVAGELGHLELQQVVALRRRVREHLQLFARLAGRVGGLLALAGRGGLLLGGGHGGGGAFGRGRDAIIRAPFQARFHRENGLCFDRQPCA